MNFTEARDIIGIGIDCKFVGVVPLLLYLTTDLGLKHIQMAQSSKLAENDEFGTPYDPKNFVAGYLAFNSNGGIDVTGESINYSKYKPKDGTLNSMAQNANFEILGGSSRPSIPVIKGPLGAMPLTGGRSPFSGY